MAQLSNPVLVVVDVQNGFVNRHSEYVVAPVVELVTEWIGKGLPVVFTRYFNQEGSAYERYFSWSRLMGSPETDLVPEVASLAEGHPVLDKYGYTLFTDEGAALVQERGWNDLVFCGIATESCVLKSATDAFERGYGPWIVTDASASDGGPAMHDAGLLVAKRLIGRGQLVTRYTMLGMLASTPRAG